MRLARTFLLSMSLSVVVALVVFRYGVDDAHLLAAAFHALSGWLSLVALVPLALALWWRRPRWGAAAAVMASLAVGPVLQGHAGAPVREGALVTDERLQPWGLHHVVPLDGSFGYAVLSRIPARFAWPSSRDAPPTSWRGT